VLILISFLIDLYAPVSLAWLDFRAMALGLLNQNRKLARGAINWIL
jgi:hypothetical protein